jgi:hypothetical protein
MDTWASLQAAAIFGQNGSPYDATHGIV